MDELDKMKDEFMDMLNKLEQTKRFLGEIKFLNRGDKKLLDEIIGQSRAIGSLGNQVVLRATELFFMAGGRVGNKTA